jgi:hypothetical protein
VAQAVAALFTPFQAAPATAVGSTTRPELSRDEQVQAFLLQRQLDGDRTYFERAGRPVYVAVSADLHMIGANPQAPSDAVMTAIGPRPFLIQPLAKYLKTVGGYEQWTRAV